MVVTVGVCCMDVKLFSRPMAAILNRLRRYDDLTVVPFGNRCIFDQPVERWPIVDFLICFFSAGFPLAKAEEYVRLRNPICFNDVLSQHLLLDRTAVYKLLQSNGIPVPPHEVFVPQSSSSSSSSSGNGSGGGEDAAAMRQRLLELKNEDPSPEEIAALSAQAEVDTGEDSARKAAFWGPDDPLQENEDGITVNGRRIKKPFVEKPVWAEDHNIFIYYPRSLGGGSKRLFRKVGDRSSRFYPNVTTIRRGGSFIYEEFVSTDGADIKVYTVGPDYAHAEARKAPTVDGRVKRTADGKEVRYHVILTQEEKEIARKITQVFGQNICGFDILRSDSVTYVCDVNGWSFVKGSPKYYNDCAQIIYEMINSYLHPLPTAGISRASRLLKDNDGMLEVPSGEYSRGKELRCLLAVIRHGDRTPKQKVKVIVSHPMILRFFDGRDPHEQVKLKVAKEMEEFSAAINAILGDSCPDSPRSMGSSTPTSKVTSPDGRFSPAPKFPVSTTSMPPLSLSSSMPKLPVEMAASGVPLDKRARRCLLEIEEVLHENVHFSGINRKVQIKPLEWAPDPLTGAPDAVVTSALLIFKYGGQLTDHGFKQADWLGKSFRQTMYPSDHTPLSLHSSFAHDIKFYASDEGRVQMTAAVFARAFLELDEEEIVPILYALVWNDRRANMLLEHSSSDSTAMMAVKKQLAVILNSDTDFSESNKALNPTQLFEGVSVAELRSLGLGKIGNPRIALAKLKSAAQQLCSELSARTLPSQSQSPSFVFSSSPLPISPSSLGPDVSQNLRLWKKLLKSFYDPEADIFDISKVPEIADLALHDYLHHKALRAIVRPVLVAVTPLANFVSPLEYGITSTARRDIASEVVRPLVDKLISDMRQMRECKQLQTVSRFYFTSESHMNSLFNFLEWRLGCAPSVASSRRMDYCSHFVFKMHENLGVPINDPRRFLVELWMSQGSNAVNLIDPPGTLHTFCQPLRPIRLNLTLDQFITLFSSG